MKNILQLSYAWKKTSLTSIKIHKAQAITHLSERIWILCMAAEMSNKQLSPFLGLREWNSSSLPKGAVWRGKGACSQH